VVVGAADAIIEAHDNKTNAQIKTPAAGAGDIRASFLMTTGYPKPAAIWRPGSAGGHIPSENTTTVLEESAN